MTKCPMPRGWFTNLEGGLTLVLHLHASTSNIICRYKLLDTKKLSLPSKMFIQHLPMKKTNESHVEICQRLVSTEILILGFLIQFPSQGTWLCKGGEEDEVNIGPR